MKNEDQKLLNDIRLYKGLVSSFDRRIQEQVDIINVATDERRRLEKNRGAVRGHLTKLIDTL